MKHLLFVAALLLATWMASGCAGSKMDDASYERAVERQNQAEFQKRLDY